MANLNFHYFNGQTFDLDQATMNKMIADVHVLKAENAGLRRTLWLAVYEAGAVVRISNKDRAAFDERRALLEAEEDIVTGELVIRTEIRRV